jgi:GINS complex subunit 2
MDHIIWSDLTNLCSKIGASKEQARREQLAEQRANGGYDGTQDEEEEDYMEF